MQRQIKGNHMSVKMENDFILEEEHKAVLMIHLPYEIDMAEASYKLLGTCPVQDSSFSKNLLIECFFTHVRALLEFFDRPFKDQNAAAAVHFTKNKIKYDFPSDLSRRINNQVSHLKYDRKYNQIQQLTSNDMGVIKSCLDKSISKFQDSLCDEAKKYWELRLPKMISFNMHEKPSATNVISVAAFDNSYILKNDGTLKIVIGDNKG